MNKSTRGMWAAFAAAGVLGALAGAVPFIPASYLAARIEQASGGHVILAETHGTIWHGSARPVFVSGGRTEALRSTALPAPVVWDWEDAGAWPWHAAVHVQGPGVINKPFVVSVRSSGVDVQPGALELPAELLEGLGSPLNTLKLGGRLSLAWDTLATHVQPGQDMAIEGVMTIDWTQARSALSPVEPLGAYRFSIKAAGAQAALDVATLSGPLLLQGQGQWRAQGGAQFTGEASAEPGHQTELLPMLGLLGRFKSPAVVELRIGT
jgi:general secretion pathway protein N